MRSMFGSVVTDLLFEKVLPNNNGVFTVNAEFKRYWAPDSHRGFFCSGCRVLFLHV